MRIEAQGKYLKTILEKAQTNISFDTNASNGIESTRSQLMDFNLALSGFMDNATQVCKENREQLVKALSDDNDKDNLGFQLYHGVQDGDDVKCATDEGLLLLDLNSRGGYDHRAPADLKMNQHMR